MIAAAPYDLLVGNIYEDFLEISDPFEPVLIFLSFSKSFCLMVVQRFIDSYMILLAESLIYLKYGLILEPENFVFAQRAFTNMSFQETSPSFCRNSN